MTLVFVALGLLYSFYFVCIFALCFGSSAFFCEREGIQCMWKVTMLGWLVIHGMNLFD